MKNKIKSILILSMTYVGLSYADVQIQTTVTTPPIVKGNQPLTITTTTTTDATPSATDERIMNMIYDKFHKTAALIGTALTVNSSKGTVTISGTVTSQSQADAAVDAAKSIPGVEGVTSNITVTTNPDLNHPKNPTSTRY